MRPEVLLEHFERIAEAPDAVGRLRRFVLDLAVRGRLVAQDAGDEPATTLISTMQKIESELIGKKKLKRKKIQRRPGEVPPFSLPYGWKWLSLQSLGVTQTGNTPSKNHPEYFGNHIPFIKPGDLTKSGIDYKNEGLSKPGLEHARLIPAGSILMVCIGSSIGKANRTERDITCNQQINTITPFLADCGAFTEISLKSSFFQKLIREKAGTGTLPILSKGKWEQLPVPLPPQAEQHRIVAKVDELMALCDELAAAQTCRENHRNRMVAATLNSMNNGDGGEDFRENARFSFNQLPRLTTRVEHVKQLRQAILNLAVRGRLVAQEPDDEPAEELLNQITHENNRLINAGKLKKQKPLPALSENDYEFNLPASWKWVRFGSIAKLWNGFAFKSSDFKTEGIPVIRIGDLRNGLVNLSSAVSVDEDIAERIDESFWVPENALLIAMSGATTGKVAFNKTGRKFLLNQRVGRIYPFIVDQSFVKIFFETIVKQNLIRSFGTAIPNLSTKQINETAFPLPPLPEQHRIVSKVDELMALCDDLETHLKNNETTATRLLDAALHEALSE